MKLGATLFIAWIGYRLGTSVWRIRPSFAVLTVVLAGILHTVVRVLLPHQAIEEFASQASSSILLVPVAGLETVGLWLPVLAIRWGTLQTRVATAAYVIAAGTIGALVYYYPFDVIVMNGTVLGPTHPEYAFALLLSLVLAAIPFACGLAVKRRRSQTATGEGLSAFCS